MNMINQIFKLYITIVTRLNYCTNTYNNFLIIYHIINITSKIINLYSNYISYINSEYIDILSKQHAKRVIIFTLTILHISMYLVSIGGIDMRTFLVLMSFTISIIFIYYINFIYKDFSSKYPIIYIILMITCICILCITSLILIKFIIIELILNRKFAYMMGYNGSNSNRENSNTGGNNNGGDNNNGNNNNSNNSNYQDPKKRSKGKGKQIYEDTEYNTENNSDYCDNNSQNDNDNDYCCGNNSDDDNYSDSDYSVYSSIRGSETPKTMEKKAGVLDIEKTLKRKHSFDQEEEDLKQAKLRSLDPTYDHRPQGNIEDLNRAESSSTAAARTDNDTYNFDN